MPPKVFQCTCVSLLQAQWKLIHSLYLAFSHDISQDEPIYWKVQIQSLFRLNGLNLDSYESLFLPSWFKHIETCKSFSAKRSKWIFIVYVLNNSV